MLDALDAVAWGELHHAHGAATDVPGYLRALIGDDAAARDRALRQLNGNVWHQGTVYAASAPVVPFLVEIGATRAVAGRVQILDLVRRIARGTSYNRQHAHLTAADEVASDAWKDAEALQLGHVRAARAAVRAAIPALCTIVASDDERAVRAGALTVLAELTEDAEALAAVVRERAAVESDPVVRATMAMALGALGAAPDALLDDVEPVVRHFAAVAWAQVAGTLDDRGTAVLLASIDGAAALAAIYPQVPFAHRNGVLFHALDVLAGHRRQDAALVDDLLARLPRATGDDALDLGGTLLNLVLGKDAPRERAGARRLFDALVAADGFWAAPVSKLLLAHDVPPSRDGLRDALAVHDADETALLARLRAIAHPPTILDRVIEGQALGTGWAAALALAGEPRAAWLAAVAAQLDAAELCDLVWRAVLLPARGDGSALAHECLIVGAAHHGAALHAALVPYATRLASDGPPRRDFDGGHAFLNSMYGVILAGAAAAGVIPDVAFDACAREVARLIATSKRWRPTAEAFAALLAPERRAALGL